MANFNFGQALDNALTASEAVEDEVIQTKKRPYVLYTVNDPDRPPFWRYERIKYVLGKPEDYQVFIKDDDVAVRYTYLAIQELAKAESPEEIFFLRKKYKGIYEALQLRKYGTLEMLGLLEGFLLTDVPLERLSARFSLEPTAIVFYQQLFFDVWDRLDANFWIETNVLRPQEYLGCKSFKLYTPAYDRSSMYRILGYHGGVIALELFATGFLASDAKPTHADLARVFLQKSLETYVANEGLLMSSSKRRLTKSDSDFLKLSLDLAARATQQGNTDVIASIKSALVAVSPLVGESVKEQLTKMVEKDADMAGMLLDVVEMRHVEQAKLQLGLEMSPETKSLIKQFNENRNK